MHEMDHTSDITKKFGENMKIVWNKKYTTIAVYAIIVLVCSALLALAAAYLPSVASSLGSVLSVVKPVIYGLVFAYILNPLNKVLEKRALKFLSKKKDHRKAQRVCAMVLTYLITLILIVLFVYAVVPQTARSVTDLSLKIRDNIPRVEEWVSDTLSSSNFLRSQVNRLEDVLSEVMNKSLDIVQWLVSYAMSIVVETTNILIGLILSVYFLASKEKLLAQTRKIISAVFSPRTVKRIMHVCTQTNNSFNGFVVGSIVDSLFIGIFCLIFCLILGIPYAPLISLIVGVTDIIPVFGPFIGAIPSAFIILISEPGKTLWFIIMIILLQQLEGNLLKPFILSDSVGLSALWVTVAITVFGGLFGVVGLIIGVPAFSVIYSLIKEATEKKLAMRGLQVETDAYYNDPSDAVLYHPRKKKNRRTLFSSRRRQKNPSVAVDHTTDPAERTPKSSSSQMDHEKSGDAEKQSDKETNTQTNSEK